MNEQDPNNTNQTKEETTPSNDNQPTQSPFDMEALKKEIAEEDAKKAAELKKQLEEQANKSVSSMDMKEILKKQIRAEEELKKKQEEAINKLTADFEAKLNEVKEKFDNDTTGSKAPSIPPVQGQSESKTQLTPEQQEEEILQKELEHFGVL